MTKNDDTLISRALWAMFAVAIAVLLHVRAESVDRTNHEREAAIERARSLPWDAIR